MVQHHTALETVTALFWVHDIVLIRRLLPSFWGMLLHRHTWHDHVDINNSEHAITTTSLNPYKFQFFTSSIRWLDGPGLESDQGSEISSSPKASAPALGPTKPPTQWGPGFLLEVKRLGRAVSHSPSSMCHQHGVVTLEQQIILYHIYFELETWRLH